MSEANVTQNDPLQDKEESCISLEEEVDNGKNKNCVKCRFCPSHILNPGLGLYTQTEFDLPVMTKRKPAAGSGESESPCDMLKHYWQVNDMYTFENIGFSNTVGDIKYLACADCEVGPIGYHNLKTKLSYVALARVNHVK